jgi:hypothetical protein
MSKALDYEVRGRGRRRAGMGQATPDILRDDVAAATADAGTVAGAEPAGADAGFLGLPLVAWIALGAGLLFLTARR